MNNVTFRSTYLSKCRVWMSVLLCGALKLPSLRNVTYLSGYCLDHILTNIEEKRVKNVAVVDSRFGDVFVSDHMGVELEITLPNQ